LIALVLAFLVGVVVFAAVGVDPLLAFRMMVSGAFGSRYAIEETLVKTTPLLLIALGLSVAYRARLWNLGGEGQFYVGAIAAAGTALFLLPDAPSVTLLPAVVVAGFLGGALWALLPGLLRAYLGVNEIISTLMLNYVAILLSEYLVHGPWRNPSGYGFPGTAPLPQAAWLPVFGTSHVHAGLLLGVTSAVVLWAVLRWTTWGHELRVLGQSTQAARYAGIEVPRTILLVMVVSGGFAGLAGMAELSGVAHQLQRNFSPGYGYTAIIVAWLAQLNPWGTIPAAVLFAGLVVGGDQLQMRLGLPGGIAPMIQGTILLSFVLTSGVLRRYRLVWERSSLPVRREAVIEEAG
jgi:simple sugar transport system permease protein